MTKDKIRNVAIIAHIDHGKTTLVDGLLRQSGVFRPDQKVAERIMDSNALERERGITILSKNTSVQYLDYWLNIVDTPGHVDFSGEVERILGMVDGCLLIVDAAEGPMAQTRFVVQKALAVGLVPILVVNKVDRPDSRVEAVVDEVLELFISLDASDDQIDFPIVYASARDQVASLDPKGELKDLKPIFDLIVEHVPPPQGDPEGPLQLMVASLDYDDYIGRLAVGRVLSGKLERHAQVAFGSPEEEAKRAKISRLYLFEGLERKEVESVGVGQIALFAGLTEISIGDTVTDPENPHFLPGIKVDEPTLAMTFLTSDSPMAGRDGKYITSRHLASRLDKEIERNVALRVDPTETPDVFDVCGRGELHLSILLETMRREGYELSVSSPRVVVKKTDGEVQEPIERLVLDIPEDSMGPVMEKLGERRADLQDMSGSGSGRLRLEFLIPMRGLIGFRSEFLTLTRGYGVMNHLSAGYGPHRGEIQKRLRGSLIASEAGTATTYAIHSLQDRGVFFIEPGDEVYAGMVVGEHCRHNDLEVNVCKKKHVTNIRSSTAEQTLRLETPRKMTLEQALEYIGDDELVEITPNFIRIRKALLCTHARARVRKEKAKTT